MVKLEPERLESGFAPMQVPLDPEAQRPPDPLEFRQGEVAQLILESVNHAEEDPLFGLELGRVPRPGSAGVEELADDDGILARFFLAPQLREPRLDFLRE